MYKNNNLSGTKSYTNPSLSTSPNKKPPEKEESVINKVLHNCNEGKFDQPYRESTDNYTTIIKKDPITGLFFAPNYSSSFADIIARLDYLGKSKLDASAIKDFEGIVFDKDYVHTDNNFTDDYKTKLEGIDANIEDRVNVKISEVTEGLHSLEGNVNENKNNIDSLEGVTSTLTSKVNTQESIIATLKSGVDYLTVFTDGLEEELSSHYTSIEDLKTTVKRVDQDAGGAFYMAYTLRGDDIDKSARTIASEEVAKIVAGADTSFDTLKEIADWIHDHPAGVAEINKEILNLKNNKVDKIAQHSLLADTEISRLATLKNYNDSEIRGIINNKVDKKQYYSLVSDSEIAKLSTVQTNANYYILPSDVPHDANYVHTDNNYTTAEKQKLSTLKNYDDTEVRGLIDSKVDLTSEQTITGKKLFADNVSPYKTSGRYWTLGESNNPWDKAYVTYLHAPWSGSTFGPQYDNSYDLGTNERLWRNVYVKGLLSDGTTSVSISNISTLNTDQTVDGVKTFNSRPVFSDGIKLSNIYPTIEQSSVVVNGGLLIGGNLSPNTLNVQGYSLGKSLAKWKDLYLSGSIITGDNTEIPVDDIASAINTTNNIPSLLKDKVDKVEGKDLSTNDYTDLEKEKVGVVPIPLATSSDTASILTNVVRHINNNDYSNCLYAVNGDLYNIIYAEQINYGPSSAIKFKWWDFKNNIFRKEASDFITSGIDDISESQIINVDTSSIKTYVDNEIVKVKKQITEIDKIEFKLVYELPTENISTSTIYLLNTGNDYPYAYDEYVYITHDELGGDLGGGEWELLGRQYFNFSDYVTVSDFNSKVQELEDKHSETDKKFANMNSSISSRYVSLQGDQTITGVKTFEYRPVIGIPDTYSEAATLDDIPTKTSQLTNDSGFVTATNHNHDDKYLPITEDIKVSDGKVLFDKIYARTSSSGTTYGVGASTQVLKSNGTNVYWGADSNSTSTLTIGSIFKAKNPYGGYQILFTDRDGLLIPAVSGSGTNTGTSKVMNTEPFNPFGPIFYTSSSSNRVVGQECSSSTYMVYADTNVSYSFNCGSTLTANRPFYIVAKMQEDGMAVLHSPYYSQTLPTSEDGLIYIYLGQTSGTNLVYLYQEHPIYVYKNGKICQFLESEYLSEYAKKSDIPTKLSDLEIDIEIGGGTDVEIPTKVSQLENDAGYISKSIIPNEINSKFAVSSSLNDLTASMTYSAIQSADSGRIRSITFGNGKFWCSNTNGVIQYTSPDSLVWNKAPKFTSNTITSITFGKGLFACIDYINTGGGNVYRSYDGENWEIATTFSEGLEKILYVNGRFTIVGTSGLVAFSDDLVTFTKATTNQTASFISITYGQNKYVAVSSSGVLIYSLDGINWNDCSISGDTTHYRVATYGRGTFVIGGAKGVIRYSYDGLTWHTATHNSTASLSYVRDLIYYNGKFFAALQHGELWTSVDGATWEVTESNSYNKWALCGAHNQAVNKDFVYLAGETGKTTLYDLAIEWLDYEPELKSGEVLWQKQFLTLSDGSTVEGEVEVHTNLKNIYDTTLNGKIGVEHALTIGNTVAGRTVLFNKEFSVDELPFAEGYVPLITATNAAGVGVGVYLQSADGTKSIHVMQCYGSPAYPLETLMRDGEWFSPYYTFSDAITDPIRQLIDNANNYFRLVDVTISLKQTISNLNLSLEETKINLDDCWSYLYDKADRSELPTKLSDLVDDIGASGSGGGSGGNTTAEEPTIIVIGQDPNYPVDGDGVSYYLDLSANGKYLVDLSYIQNEGGEAYVTIELGFCKGYDIGKLMNATAPRGIEQIGAGFPNTPTIVSIYNNELSGNLYYIEVEDYYFRFYGQYIYPNDDGYNH